jgi:hypothetical protein
VLNENFFVLLRGLKSKNNLKFLVFLPFKEHLPEAVSGRDKTQHQATLVLDAPIRGNDWVGSCLEIP